MTSGGANDAPPALVALRQPGHFEDRQWSQHLLRHQPRRDSYLVDRRSAAAGQRLIHQALGLAQAVEPGAGMRFLGCQLADATDQLDNFLGSGNQLRAVA